MEDINLLLAESLNKYFKALSITGYVDLSNVNNLIVLSGISYILDNFQNDITEEDLKVLINVLQCISGDCFIEYVLDLTENSLLNMIGGALIPRITETGGSNSEIIRHFEDHLFKNISK